MSGWYSNLKSSVSNLQRTVFNSEADGDTDDDTHVCRVLRAYYIEKNQGFPQWLPPDPKAPPPIVVQQSVSPAPGSRYGNLQGATQSASSGLSSLWDKNRAGGAGGAASASPVANSRNPFANRAAVTPDPQSRPLPSQRTGSYQSTGAASAASTGSGGGSIQDRLRGRLGGGARTVSPGNNSGPFAPPAPAGGGGGSGDYDPYRAGSYGDGGGSGSRYGGGGGLPSGPRRMGGLPSGPRMR